MVAPALATFALLLSRSGGAAAAATGCAGEGCSRKGMGSEHVLLQSRQVRLLASVEGEQNTESCDGCLAAIDAADGCAAMLNPDFLFDHELADFDAQCGHCSSEVLTHCSPLLQGGTCDACVTAFDEAGGCGVMKQIMEELHGNPDANVTGLQASLLGMIPPGCQPCGEDAARHCSADLADGGDSEAFNPAACEACIQALDEAGACAEPDAVALNGSAAEACATAGEACRRIFEAHCAEKKKGGSSETCKTASPGEQCFMAVRWAMQVGVTAHPQWYEGLTQESSFEDFQRRLHAGSRYSCPMPCAEEETACHTAVRGEECYTHVAWAKQAGVDAVPQWYPKELTRSSPAEEFQAWLHHIHHGGCSKPCSA